MQETLLVTGGAGFIGSHFVERTVRHGYFPLVLDKLTYAGSRENLSHLPDAAYRLVVGDINDGELISSLLSEHRPVGVVHLAAESHVDNSIAGPGAFIETNIAGTYHLLHAALAYWRKLAGAEGTRFRFVHVSTDEVYGALPLGNGHFTESSPLLPNSPYSASKAASDHLARAWHRTYGLPVVVTHCSNNYGPRQHSEKLIPHMIACALSGKPLPVYGDGKNVRDWIHVTDHCEGLLLSLTRGRAGEVYNFGGAAEIDNLSLVKRICALLDEMRPGKESYAGRITFVADRLGHDLRYAIDDSKAVRELGFSHTHTLEKGLRETVRWYLEHTA